MASQFTRSYLEPVRVARALPRFRSVSFREGFQ